MAEGLESLCRFVERERSAYVPLDHIEGTFLLGRWVANRRRDHKAGRLDPKQVIELEALPGWAWTATHSTARWEAGFACLADFAAREGHTMMQAREMNNDFRLGAWVFTQRQAYKKGTLSAARATRLEALPAWTWSAFGSRWEEGFSRLARFGQREGHLKLPMKYREDGFPLWRWAKAQRAAYRRGELDPERARKLEAIPGWVGVEGRRKPNT